MLAIHRDQIETFGGHVGMRDEHLLDSAIAQPRISAGGRLAHRTVHEQAAAYLFHLCSNHPFIDGNKRVAFAAMDTFLQINGLRLTLNDDEAYELTMAVARGERSKRQIAALVRAHSERIE